MARKKSQVWDVDNEVIWWDVGIESSLEWDEGYAPSFRVWPEEGEFTALIDADMIPYIVGFSQSEEDFFKACQFCEGLETGTDEYFEKMLKCKQSNRAVQHCDDVLNTWVDNTQADSAKLYLTGSGESQFRYNVAYSKLYKGGASRGKPKPPFFHLLKWYLEKRHGAIVAWDCEADDLMSIEQWQRNQELVMEGADQGSEEAKRFSKTCIVTKDKDLRMIAGWHSNPDINNGEPYWVDERGFLEPKYKDNRMIELKGAGLLFFYAQLIMGDKVDNYGGIPMKGPAHAYQVLKDCTSGKQMHKKVLECFKQKYGDKPFDFKTWTGETLEVTYMDMFVEQGRLAWMQREHGQVWMPSHALPDPRLWRTQ